MLAAGRGCLVGDCLVGLNKVKANKKWCLRVIKAFIFVPLSRPLKAADVSGGYPLRRREELLDGTGNPLRRRLALLRRQLDGALGPRSRRERWTRSCRRARLDDTLPAICVNERCHHFNIEPKSVRTLLVEHGRGDSVAKPGNGFRRRPVLLEERPPLTHGEHGGINALHRLVLAVVALEHGPLLADAPPRGRVRVGGAVAVQQLGLGRGRRRGSVLTLTHAYFSLDL